MMRLRKHVFQLLDHNLLLGETTTGVYMHDVVHEHCIATVGPEDLRQNQRRLARLASPRGAAA